MYLPYGTPRPGGTGTLPTDFTFTGQRADATGLMYFKARYYSSYLNRWIQPDTIVPDFANPQSLNRFSYVRNNPLRYTDLSGHCEVCKRVVKWLQVQYEKAEEWWALHNPYGSSLTTGPGPGWSPSSPSQLARSYAAASGRPIDPRALQAAQWSERLMPLVLEFGSLWGPNRDIGPNEDVPYTGEGLQMSTGEKFANVMLGQKGDEKTKYLWAIDEQGIKIARELTPFDTPRGNIVHTNLSPNGALFAGEMWFVSDNEVVINAGSGRYGYSKGSVSIEEAARRYAIAAQMFEALGYKVTVIPVTER